jgi:hypothetical protein
VLTATVMTTTSDCARLTATSNDDEGDYAANNGDYDGNNDGNNYEASHYHYSSDAQYDDEPSAGDGEAYEDAISVSEAGK